MGMTAPLEASGAEPAAEAAPPTPAVDRLLEAIRSKGYSEDAFSHELQALVASEPEAAWELVSLLDQQFRRGEIRPADYRAVNSQLIALLLGSPYGVDRRTGPVPRSAASPAVDVATGPIVSTVEIGAHEPVATDVPQVGRTLRGRYRILRVVGRGGLGTVFEAADEFRVGPPDDRRVALKVLHPTVSGRPDMLSALVREFQHVQRLSHPNIVRVHEIDRDGAITFFTMELLAGLTLDRLMAARGQAALDHRHALAIVREIAAALAHAHANGLVHGDINLHNVFVTEAGAVRVLDFGSSSKLREEPWIDDADAPERTRFATLQYASGEMLEGSVADVRDDLFALACVAYVLLTGRHPYGERTALQARALRVRPSRPSGLAWRQWRALRGGLALRRDRRPNDVAAWTRRLIGDGSIPPLPPLSALVRRSRRASGSRLRPAVGIAALLLVAGVWWVSRPRDSRGPVAIPIEASHVATARRRVPIVSAARARTPVGAAGSTFVASTASARSRSSSEVTPTSTNVRSGVAVATTPPLIEVARSRVVVWPRDPVARVPVERVGSSRKTIRFRWAIEPGTARRGKDFEVVGSRVASIGRGRRSVALLIPIVFDPTRARPVDFYLTITSVGAGTRLGSRKTTKITILPGR